MTLKNKSFWSKLLCLTLTLVLAGIVFAGCISEEEPPVQHKGNIIFGGERPDYDELFDYNSGYVPPEPVNLDRTLKLLAGSKVTFADGSKAAQIKAGSNLPVVVSTYQGVDIAGWYNVDKTSDYWRNIAVLRDKHPTVATQNGVAVPAFVMPKSDLTIAPFFVEQGKRPLIAASSHYDNVSTGVTYLRAGTRLFETDIGMQIGTEINYDGPESTGNNGRFRFLTSCASVNSVGEPGLILAGSHTFYFWFKNLGEETLKFQAYQVSSGTTLIDGANTDVITLTPGQSIKASITVELAQNHNVMTFIYLRQAQTNAKLGIVMSKNP